MSWFQRRGPNSRRAGLLVGLVVGLLAVGSSFALSGLRGASNDPTQEQAAATSSAPSSALGTVPECDPSMKAASEVDISTPEGSGQPFQLTSECYAAPADESFTIVFSNVTVAVDGGGGTEQNLSIYPNQQDAVSVAADGTTVGPENHKTALFIGSVVEGPGKIEYDVPKLPAGTYYIQSDYAPTLLYATLIVN
jgi:hypothetical protein